MDRTPFTSRHFSPRLPAAAIALLLLLASPAHAAEATVVLSQECQYLLLDSPEGQMLVKMLEGEKPKVGDRLQGSFAERTSATLKVTRTGGNIRVWINLIERSTTKALTVFAQYCE